MSEDRTVGVSPFVAVVLLCMASAQCSMMRDIDRIADHADISLCLEAVKAGVELNELPKFCRSKLKSSKKG